MSGMLQAEAWTKTLKWQDSLKTSDLLPRCSYILSCVFLHVLPPYVMCYTKLYQLLSTDAHLGLQRCVGRLWVGGQLLLTEQQGACADGASQGGLPAHQAARLPSSTSVSVLHTVFEAPWLSACSSDLTSTMALN